MRLTKFETNYIEKVSKMHEKNLLYIKVMFHFRLTFWKHLENTPPAQFR